MLAHPLDEMKHAALANMAARIPRMYQKLTSLRFVLVTQGLLLHYCCGYGPKLRASGRETEQATNGLDGEDIPL